MACPGVATAVSTVPSAASCPGEGVIVGLVRAAGFLAAARFAGAAAGLAVEGLAVDGAVSWGATDLAAVTRGSFPCCGAAVRSPGWRPSGSGPGTGRTDALRHGRPVVWDDRLRDGEVCPAGPARCGASPL
ncbi:hypothetical protein ASG41_18545 [Modestobacter sp. Leaf380]|nr:hypothetical protein ASG41_18545 [Modestobacter sp. Leaf380]